MEKTAFDIGFEEGVKTAWSVTDRGHKFDADLARDQKEYFLQRARALQAENAIAYNDPKKGIVRGNFLDAIRFGEAHPTIGARHQAYVEKKHRAGKNAYNPMGGVLTPVEQEAGGTPGFFGLLGKVKSKKG